MKKNVTFGEISSYIFKKSWIIIIFAVVFAGIFGVYSKLNKETTYTATSQVIIAHDYSEVSRKDDLFKLDMDMAPTYEKLESNSTILKSVVKSYNKQYKHSKKIKIRDLNDVKIKGTSGSLTYVVSVSSNKSAKAIKMANVFNSVLKENVHTLVPNSGEVHILEKASKDNVESETTPSTKKYAVLGFVLGFVIAVLVILIRYSLIIRK